MKLLALAAVALPALAFGQTISTSKHNLTNAGPGTIKATGGNQQLCIYCHTPHNPSQVPALWNRTNPASVGFSTYTVSAMGTALPTTINDPSLKCLSCHDGTVAFGAFYNNYIYADNTAAANWNGSNNVMPAGITKVGPDLSGNHPVSMNYSTWNNGTPATEFNTAAAIDATALKLYTSGATYVNSIECGTCHDPHKPGTVAADTAPFLRMSNANSAICTACHTK